jgi:hypothetical protein
MSTDSYHFKVGQFACTLVFDGTFTYPHPAQIVFAGAPPDWLATTQFEDEFFRMFNRVHKEGVWQVRPLAGE